MQALFFDGSSSWVKAHVLAMSWFKNSGSPRMARLIGARMQRKYGVFVSAHASLHDSVDLKHPIGIVIGDGVIINENVTIYQNVTLGGARRGDQMDNRYPVIGAGTTIYAGAVVVGRVTVGSGCVIGANAVVLSDVPDGSTVVGIPARVIDSASRKTSKEKNYGNVVR